MYIYLNIYMYQWLKTMYDVVKAPTTTTKKPEKNPTRNPNRCYFVNRKYVSRMYHIQNLLWVVCLLFFYMYKETEFIVIY